MPLNQGVDMTTFTKLDEDISNMYDTFANKSDMVNKGNSKMSTDIPFVNIPFWLTMSNQQQHQSAPNTSQQ